VDSDGRGIPFFWSHFILGHRSGQHRRLLSDWCDLWHRSAWLEGVGSVGQRGRRQQISSRRQADSHRFNEWGLISRKILGGFG